MNLSDIACTADPQGRHSASSGLYLRQHHSPEIAARDAAAALAPAPSPAANNTAFNARTAAAAKRTTAARPASPKSFTALADAASAATSCAASSLESCARTYGSKPRQNSRPSTDMIASATAALPNCAT